MPPSACPFSPRGIGSTQRCATVARTVRTDGGGDVLGQRARHHPRDPRPVDNHPAAISTMRRITTVFAAPWASWRHDSPPEGGRFVATCESQAIYVDRDHPSYADGITRTTNRGKIVRNCLHLRVYVGYNHGTLKRLTPPICPPGQDSGGRIGGRIRSSLVNAWANSCTSDPSSSRFFQERRRNW